MRTITINAKCSNLCYITFNDGKKEYEKDGYPPRINGLSGGDYVNITIDLDTGKIVGWQVPSNEDIKEAMDIEDDEEFDEDIVIVENESQLVNTKTDLFFNDFDFDIPSEEEIKRLRQLYKTL